MVMDPTTTEDRAWDEARFIANHKWSCGLLLVVSFVAFLSWTTNNPLVWVFAIVVGALFAIEPLVRKGGLGPVLIWLTACIRERLRPKPQLSPMAFTGGLPFPPFRVPWRLTLICAIMALGIAGIFAAGHAIRAAEDRAVGALAETQAALSRALEAEQRALLAEEALSLAAATNRAQEAARTIVSDAVTVIRYVPARPRVQPSPADPSPAPLVGPDAFPDPVPVFANALGSLLDNPGGLSPSPT